MNQKQRDVQETKSHNCPRYPQAVFGETGLVRLVVGETIAIVGRSGGGAKTPINATLYTDRNGVRDHIGSIRWEAVNG